MPHEQAESALGFLWGKAVDAAQAVGEEVDERLAPVLEFVTALQAQGQEFVGEAHAASPVATDFNLLLSHLGYEPGSDDGHEHQERATRRPRRFNTDHMTKQQIRARATEILEGAGVDPAMIPELVADEAAAAAIVDSPQVAMASALRFPSPAYSAYGQFVQGFPEGTPPAGMAMAGFSMTDKPPTSGYRTDDAGRVLYDNGVLFDPNAASGSDILFPPNDPDAQGSLAWFAKVRDEWQEAKVETWRKRLVDLGYDLVVQGLSEKGGWDQAFKSALTLYHKDRYRNLGKPLPVAEKGRVKATDFGGTLNPNVLKQEVSVWFNEAFGDDPSEDEAEFWASKVRDTSLALANAKGLDPGAAVTVARGRIQEKFREDPATKKWQELEETDTSLHDSFVNLFQVLSQ